jgi:hypothetical protein
LRFGIERRAAALDEDDIGLLGGEVGLHALDVEDLGRHLDEEAREGAAVAAGRGPREELRLLAGAAVAEARLRHVHHQGGELVGVALLGGDAAGELVLHGVGVRGGRQQQRGAGG